MHKLQVQTCALPLLVPLGVTTARAVPGLTPQRLGVWTLQKAAGGIRLRGGHGLVPSPDSESLMLRDQMAATAGGQNGSGVCVHLTCRLAGVTTLGGHQDASAVTALRGLSEPAPSLRVCPTPAHRGLGLAGRGGKRNARIPTPHGAPARRRRRAGPGSEDGCAPPRACACVVGPETQFLEHRMGQVGEKAWDKGRSCVVCVHK